MLGILHHLNRPAPPVDLKASDIEFLFSTMCGSNQYLKGDGTCATAPTSENVIIDYEDLEPIQEAPYGK